MSGYCGRSTDRGGGGRGGRGGRGGSVGSGTSRRPLRTKIEQITPANFAQIIDRYQATFPCERCGDSNHSILQCRRAQPRWPSWLWQRIIDLNITAQANAHIASLQQGASGPIPYHASPQNMGSMGNFAQRPTTSTFGSQSQGLQGNVSNSRVPGPMNPLNDGINNLTIAEPAWQSPTNFSQDGSVQGRGRGRGGYRGGTQRGNRGGNHGGSAGTASATSPVTFAGELSYPRFRPLTIEDRTPNGVGREWKLSEAVKNAKETSGAIESPTHPIRQNFLDLQPESKVLTNQFEYSVSADVFYEYKINNIGSKDKRKTKLVYQKAIESWEFLKSHSTKLVTNNFDSIVAWENLHQHILEGLIRGDNESTGLWKMTLQDGTSSLELEFELVRKIDVSDFQRYSNADPQQENQSFDVISRCLNLVISKTFDDSKLYRQSANKFFVKDARSPLWSGQVSSQSLEIVRGYYYNVKPGTGCIILNFNLATSAFFKPILVSNFLQDTNTFGGHQEDNLRGLRVFVVTDRRRIPGEETNYDKLNSASSRTKKVNFIGPALGTVTFQMRVKNADGTFAKNPDGSYRKTGNHINVVNYLRDTFGHTANTTRKAINCGTEKEPVWYAQEQLQILPWQIYRRPVPEKFASGMVQEAAKKPDESRALIENEGLRNLGFDQQSVTSALFSNVGNSNEVPIQLVPTMMQVPCQILRYPCPSYKTVTNNSTNPSEGRQAKPVTLPAAGGARWKVPPDSVFFSTKPKVFKFGFLRIRKDPLQDRQDEFGKTYQVYPREQHKFAVDDDSVTKYSDEIKRQLNRCGLTASDIDLQLPTALQDLEIRDLEAALQTAKDDAYDLVILMLPKPNVGIYSRFKTLAERASGLQSVVVVSKFSAPDKNYLLAECITNIMMKINLKLGGFTHSVKDVQSYLSQQDVMVLGADVVHAGPSAFDGCPSIASIVGSVDYSAGRCLGSARLQRIEKEAKDDKGNAKPEQITDREIIQEVEAMVTERLEDWIRHSEKKTLPKNILYYRDGVSATQYEQVKLKELQAIRDAYSKLANKFGTTSEVGLTAVVVTKRHHTRFYPMSHKLPDPPRGEKKPTYPDRDAFGNYNTKPGLFVDQLVTSPYYQDFFLQSHSAIKGTAKPTHYFILEAGIEGLDLEKLRDLTHAICFSYVRGTVGVSYASPTYYADRLCERSRTYMRRYFVKTEDVAGPDNLEAALASEKHRLEQHYTTLLDSLYPKNRQFADKKDEKKYFKDRKATEADHRKEIMLGLRRFVFEKVEDDFYKFKDQTVDGKPWLNPWDPCLRDTMFWM